MEPKDLMWQIFSTTGNINHYLLYSELSNKKGGTLHGPDKYKSNSSADSSIWRLRQDAHPSWRDYR
ncbi:MAG: YqzL family protein [Clostridia bacterium]|nr:YqzL family protein [Clostridia bacterium]